MQKLCLHLGWDHRYAKKSTECCQGVLLEGRGWLGCTSWVQWVLLGWAGKHQNCVVRFHCWNLSGGHNIDTQMTLKSDTTVSQKRRQKCRALIVNPIHRVFLALLAAEWTEHSVTLGKTWHWLSWSEKKGRKHKTHLIHLLEDSVYFF